MLGSETQVNYSSQVDFDFDSDIMQAQLALFIKLGNMDELNPDQNFGGIVNLGYALIDGDIEVVKEALRFYDDASELLEEHSIYLSEVFAHVGVEVLEPALLHLETPYGLKTSVVLAVALERAGKIAYISSDESYPSYVNPYHRDNGLLMIDSPTQEDPQLLLRQISRVIRISEPVAPPPTSMPSI